MVGGPDTAEATDPTVDRLSLCLIDVARARGMRLSAAEVRTGLGIGNDRLAPGELAAAGHNVGLAVRAFETPLERLPSHLLPCILLLEEGGALVLHELTDTHASLYVPEFDKRMRLSRDELVSRYAGVAYAAMPSDAPRAVRGDTQEGSWFWGTIRGMRGEYTKVVLASFLVNSLAIAAPLFTLNVYDRVLPNSSFSTLWVLAIGMAVVLVFDLAFRALRGLVIDGAGRWADIRLASRIYDHVLRMRMDQRPAQAGEFANRLRDFESVRDFFSSATVLAAIDIAFIVLFLAVIHMVGGPMVFIPAAAVVVVLVIGIAVQPLMLHAVRDVQDEAAERHGLLVESLLGVSAIKALNAEDVFLKRWQALVARTARSTERVRTLSLNLINSTLIVQQAVTVGLIIFGTYLFDRGDITMGGIIATVMLASRAVGPLGLVAGTLGRLQQSRISLKNLDDIMATPRENADLAPGFSREIESGTLRFEDVDFAYPGTEHPAIRGASFRIEEGDKIGVIGRVGAGKSTLVQLMAGLYPPTSGSVSVGGINLAQLHTRDLRDAVGYVEQDTFLFEGSVLENIAMGRPDVSDADVERAARISGADAFIDAHPQGFNMPVGERGRRLSGGQRQLVALARALLRKPRILVLDEPTSAMDTASEALFMQRLEEAAKDSTLIVATHRHALLGLVDKLMVIDRGRIAAFGPKDKVMALLRSKAGDASGTVVALARPEAANAPEEVAS